MKKFILNIGLDTSTKFGYQSKTLSSIYVMQQVKKIPHLEILKYSIAQSNTEATLVLELVYSGSAPLDMSNLTLALYKLSNLLHQDCIAFYDVLNDQGVLIGKYAGEWGTFNKDYFIQF